ncbi:hypothetical protein RND71_025137 [Anisodus tanguticus]|uniref:Uncharacterized protein n=1 Tax=Anisodus tanguticus TaxID=243964 RepID=A0AAE1RSD6_9SOLA|nr:hypothetical protein RND71_025137 [Anisodus tanguticus]
MLEIESGLELRRKHMIVISLLVGNGQNLTVVKFEIEKPSLNDKAKISSEDSIYFDQFTSLYEGMGDVWKPKSQYQMAILREYVIIRTTVHKGMLAELNENMVIIAGRFLESNIRTRVQKINLGQLLARGTDLESVLSYSIPLGRIHCGEERNVTPRKIKTIIKNVIKEGYMPQRSIILWTNIRILVSMR